MSFFYDYFVKGWSTPTPYNIYNTVAYFILAVVITYLSYNYIFRRLKFSAKTAIDIVPFMILGAFVRVLADTPIIPRNFFTVTPGVWLIFFSLIALSLLFDNKYGLRLTPVLPIPFIFILAFLMPVENPDALFYFSLFYSLSLIPFFILRSRFNLLRNDFNLLCITAHMFDATSSFVNVNFFGYVEIHVVGGFLTSVFGTAAVMYLLKLVVIPILYYLDREEDRNLVNFMKLIIFALGFGPGIRNLITVLYGI